MIKSKAYINGLFVFIFVIITMCTYQCNSYARGDNSDIYNTIGIDKAISEYEDRVELIFYPKIDRMIIDILFCEMDEYMFDNIFLNDRKMNYGKINMADISDYQKRKLADYGIFNDKCFYNGIIFNDYYDKESDVGFQITTWWYGYCNYETSMFKVYVHSEIPDIVLFCKAET